MKLKQRHRSLLRGIASFVPGIKGYILNRSRTGGTGTARYCYTVWLRHLVMAHKNGLNPYPKTVAELGPGDSIGIGLAALISGCDKYYGFDIVDFTDNQRNASIFDELVLLFQNRAPIPDEKDFPQVKPYLESYAFPADIFDDDRLQQALDTSRLEKLRSAVLGKHIEDSPIQFQVPWYDIDVVKQTSVDMIYSQAVLEHVDELRNTYKIMRQWLKPEGFMSHQIDFGCHGTADEWNGHWTFSDFRWKLIVGGRPYLLNRKPHSAHISMLSQEGFRVVFDLPHRDVSNIKRRQLAPNFSSITDDDLTIRGAFIQAVRQ